MERVHLLLYLNAVLVFAAWFSMTGNLWIRYGSHPRVEFRGAYPELQQHIESGHEAALSFGVLTYTIDYWHNGIRARGLPTLWWTQLFLLVLVAADVSELIRARDNSHARMNPQTTSKLVS